MGIPYRFDPLGTLGASPLPPGFRPLAYVKTTSNGPKPNNLPWAGLRFTAFNQETDSLIIDGGATDGNVVIFYYAAGNSQIVGASTYNGDIRANNGQINAYALSIPYELGKICHIVVDPNKVSIDDRTKFMNFQSLQPSFSVWNTGAILARVEHKSAEVSVETVVAAERIVDGARGLVSLMTGVFLEV